MNQLIFAALGFGGIGVIVGIFILLNYPKIKIIISDILRLFGGLGNWFRKRSLETEIEGSINLCSKNFNSTTDLSIFPPCTVQWVNEENKESYLHEGKAIVRMSFHKQNHDLNLYNVAHAYVKAGALPRTKPFIKKQTRDALDLIITKLLLLQSGRGGALSVLNDRFREEPIELKEVFYKFEETDFRGFFRSLLLPEFQFLGEVLGDVTPTSDIDSEIEGFIEWLYVLVTRGEGERTTLMYMSQHIKVGVILVADESTYSNHGISPYLRRATSYANKDFGSIYLCSRGRIRGQITKAIARELSEKGGFDILTKYQSTIKYDTQGNEIEITCIALKPDAATIIQSAWERLRKLFDAIVEVNAVVMDVERDCLVVNAEGLRIVINKLDASSIDIPDLRRYFENDQILSLRILDINFESQTIHLSNKNTQTDPSEIIRRIQGSLEASIETKVCRIFSKNDYESGINVTIPGSEILGFLPRKALTYSNFKLLSSQFPIGSTLIVIPISFDITYKTLACRLPQLVDPWADINKYTVGSKCSVIIRQVSEQRIICEFEDGIEGVIPVSELSWDITSNLLNIKEYKVGSTIDVCIVSIDLARRLVYASLKRITQNPAQLFVDRHKDSDVEITIDSVSVSSAAASITNTQFNGFIPASQVIWDYCHDVSEHFKPGQLIKARPIKYDEVHNTIVLSPKLSIQNDFDQFTALHTVGAVVEGTPYAYENNKIRIKIFCDEIHKVEAYIHKSQLSALMYIDETNIQQILALHKNYKFLVKRIDTSFKIVELSRKEILKQAVNTLEYGKEYEVSVISNRSKYVAINEDFEALLIGKVQRRNSEQIKVIVARLDKTSGRVEVAQSS